MKVGFEAEFATGVESLIARLYNAGYAGADGLHSYHCPCDYCGVIVGEYAHLFRAQRDSSCGGEIITKVLTSESAVARAATVLQEAAIEVDAEPGQNAGFHVHSDVRRLFAERKHGDAFIQYLLWEPTLALLSAGRWTANRGNNRPVRSQVGEALDNNGYSLRDLKRSAEVRYDQGDYLLDYHCENDRHSFLNTSTRHGTWEFRLWNSTRSAWRMEMFCGLSDAFTNPVFIETAVAGIDGITIDGSAAADNIDLLAELLDNSEHEAVAALVRRQQSYLNERAHDCAWLAFTA